MRTVEPARVRNEPEGELGVVGEEVARAPYGGDDYDRKFLQRCAEERDNQWALCIYRERRTHLALD